jgi:predicted GNAT family acetyltransferase
MTMNPIQHNTNERRFEMHIDGKVSFMQYSPINRGIEIKHTEVDKSLEGNGIAGVLARHAIQYARNNNLRILPSCPYMRVFMRQNTEYHDLIM